MIDRLWRSTHLQRLVRQTVLFLAFSAAPLGAMARWTVTNLHPIGGEYSAACGVSSVQQVGHAGGRGGNRPTLTIQGRRTHT